MQRLIRLHRPFYIRSFQDKRYEYSRTTALYAAKQIALGHRRLVKMGCKREWIPSILSQRAQRHTTLHCRTVALSHCRTVALSHCYVIANRVVLTARP
jgi:hypothetical protein